MTALAPTLEAFFTSRLINEKGVSPHTIAAYRDTFRLLLRFAQQRTGKQPSNLELEDLDAALITAFLDHLEHERANSPRTRNARLAAIHSMFRFAALRHPEHAALISRVIAVPTKRFDRAIVSYLTPEEVNALLAAPDRTRWIGRRDHALMTVAIQTGLRVTELINLRCQDAHLGTGPHVQASGKGRKQRATPLTSQTVAVLREWTQERDGQPGQPLFPTGRGRALSRDAIALLVTKHATTASRSCPTLENKKISPHVLRHTAAMNLLHAGVDSTVIALWLGHESVEATQIYLHADMAIKEQALARTTPPNSTPGRYRPPDTLLAFLEAL
ncbi:MAG TPA: tyrosine-type recombinase/integrase [Vicinamibacterales bacterium]|jgi:integrase/recombinase XerD|nr:tyrosine-type recombinase/integrase [Vicinamibacterales bacterium]